MQKNLKIRNSTAEFLIFTSQSEEDSIEVKASDENVWLTQNLIEIETMHKFGNSEFINYFAKLIEESKK